MSDYHFGRLQNSCDFLLVQSIVYWKDAQGPVVIEKDSPGPSKLGQAPVVPLDNNGREKDTTVVVTQEVTEPKPQDGTQSIQTNLSNANNGGVEVRQKNIEQEFPIDTREKITIKIDPEFILDERGYMQHSGFKGTGSYSHGLYLLCSKSRPTLTF